MKTPSSSSKAIWSITWRSILLTPLMFPLALLWFVLVIVIAVLPFMCVGYLWFGEWKHAGLHFLVWALLIFAYRRFRLARLFEWPPSVL